MLGGALTLLLIGLLAALGLMLRLVLLAGLVLAMNIFLVCLAMAPSNC
jgi:hypothetical protein